MKSGRPRVSQPETSSTGSQTEPPVPTFAPEPEKPSHVLQPETPNIPETETPTNILQPKTPTVLHETLPTFVSETESPSNNRTQTETSPQTEHRSKWFYLIPLLIVLASVYWIVSNQPSDFWRENGVQSIFILIGRGIQNFIIFLETLHFFIQKKETPPSSSRVIVFSVSLFLFVYFSSYSLSFLFFFSLFFFISLSYPSGDILVLCVSFHPMYFFFVYLSVFSFFVLFSSKE